jgi:hypothetical protein
MEENKSSKNIPTQRLANLFGKIIRNGSETTLLVKLKKLYTIDKFFLIFSLIIKENEAVIDLPILL